ncbi:molecular chaperone [Thalassotalea sp. HSM 43]|uniref:TorD/DmsD family molecular chaperone n=1 Tax=Thalassotalea sp. HSM 43 TaxID=2552945 RepID=UPI0010806F4F|nr:molecular chaperone TorD family protein [Thalassotalea sp. HSM 43]QBY05270.1 molecular chaperone [Thalassotalea sp. HSM 43]
MPDNSTIYLNDRQFRIDVYQLLAALMRNEPQTDMLQLLGNLHIETQQARNTALLNCFARLKQQANMADIEQLQHHFFELFIGLSQGEINPYGSWYRENKLMSNTLLRLRADLQQLGISREEQVKEPEDHISALCEVMAILIQDKAEHQQIVFFEQHIAPWFEPLCNKLSENRLSPFYASVGELASVFLQQEQTLLDHLRIQVSIN